MAQLVKLKTRPTKYYYQQHQQLWPVNQIIPRDSYEFKLNTKSSFQEFEGQITHVLKSYLTKWDEEIARAHERGSMHRRHKIISDIIALALEWQRNISKEASALMVVAAKIASSILNTRILSPYNHKLVDDLAKTLQDFFNINIFLPENLYKDIKIQSKPINFFIPDIIFTKHNHNKNAFLKISLNGTTEEIDLTEFNLRRMLSMAVKNIIR